LKRLKRCEAKISVFRPPIFVKQWNFFNIIDLSPIILRLRFAIYEVAFKSEGAIVRVTLAISITIVLAFFKISASFFFVVLDEAA